jgi:hypothetical protein
VVVYLDDLLFGDLFDGKLLSILGGEQHLSEGALAQFHADIVVEQLDPLTHFIAIMQLFVDLNVRVHSINQPNKIYLQHHLKHSQLGKGSHLSGLQ